MSFEAGPEFESLLDFLRRSRGFDFTGYKRASLLRRVGRRASQVGVDNFADYMDYLEVHPDEFPSLFNTILINVTEFFRDPPAWSFLAEEVLPKILAKPADQPIRIWSAGCASGEEAYSIAILLAETMGGSELVQRVKIYATDVDEEALAAGRAGYSASALAGLDPDLVARYFESVGSTHVFKAALRRALIFGRHDLIQDAPISRVDLLLCRNTIMYFTAESQGRVLGRFHYALNEDGYLFLGKAEMLLTHGNFFTPLDLKHRIFTKVARARDRALLAVPGGQPEAYVPRGQREFRVRELATDLAPVAQLTIDLNGSLVAANQVARSQFKINISDLGSPLRDLEVSYLPAELRGSVAKANLERRPITIRNVEHRLANGAIRRLEIEVAPLLDENESLVGTSVTFADVTDLHRLQAELDRSKHDIETAYEELQSSNEELETTNEELQSTVEELETTNEELQSSNEELETMNEELESSNAELETINGDLRHRGDEIDRLNTFMQSILGSLQVGVAVLNNDFQVTMWNARAEDLWGLRAEEVVGSAFFGLDIGLPVEKLRPLVKKMSEGEAAGAFETLASNNRRGRSIRCRVVATPLPGAKGSRGVVLLMEELKA